MVNTNLWTRTSQWSIGGWLEKKDRSHPSVTSLGRDGMSGRVAKVKPRPEPPPQDPGTSLQHLVDSEVLLEQKRRSDTTGLPSSRRRIRNGSPRDIVFRSQKETVFLAISFALRPAVTNSHSHRGRCAAVWSR